MKIQEISCKSALSISKLPGLNYSLNPYIGCMHQCKYCYAPSILRISKDEWEEIVKIKRNIPKILAHELKFKKPGTIGISTVTDPYQPLEKTYKIVKYCLEILSKYDFPICIQTKSDLIIRDKQLIEQCKDVEVMVSIGTLNDAHRKLFEPGSSSVKERLKILKTFSKSPIKTSVFFGPIYPTISINEITSILDVFLEHEIDEIMIDYLHLKAGILTTLKQTIQGNVDMELLFSNQQVKKQKQKFQIISKKIKKYLSNTSVRVQEAF
jgi:DNA repair photolyase